MKMTGRGKAKLAALEGEGAQRVAKITEDLAYEVDTSGFSTRMKKASRR
jgi:hypothetical protein